MWRETIALAKAFAKRSRTLRKRLMKLPNLAVFFTLIVMICSAPGVAQRTTTPSQAAIALTASARPSLSQSWDEREFVGTINNTLKVRIKLSRADKVLSGSYVYERIGKSIRLSGTMPYENEFYLDEFDEHDVKTGKFGGKFVSKDWIEGTWSSTSTKKDLPFSARAIDGKQIPAANANDRISGEYSTIDKRGDRNSSMLDVWLLKDGQVRVKGNSTWVGNARTGNVNVGEVDGIFELQGSKLLFKDGDGDDDCRFTITFGVDSLTVTNDNLRCGGLNVSFDGKYRKVGSAKSE